MRYLLVGLLFSLALPVSAQRTLIAGLRCEYRINPLGVDNAAPLLSWVLEDDQRNITQAGYQLIVANDSLMTSIVWDSGKTGSPSQQVVYKGPTLSGGKKYWWKVRVWDNKRRAWPWSRPASWQMGLLKAADWAGAKWIAYETIHDTAIIAPHVHLNGKKAWGARRNVLPRFRKSFTIAKPVKSVTAFVSGLGHFEMQVNGAKTGDHFLDPGWTNYQREALYVTFDITRQCRQGENAVGMLLGNGFYYIPGQRYRKMTGAYGLPKMIMRIAVDYADGTSENIVSDDSWQTAPSPVVFSSIYGGEDYDARLESSTGWKAALITDGPALASQMAEPVKVMEQFTPVKSNELRTGVTIYDLGQNFSGIPAIRVRGNRGDSVRIIPGELLNEDGSVNQKASGSPSYFTYILKGGEEESWQPRFTYYGFRYLQVETVGSPVLTQIAGLHIRNAAEKTGSFHCSNELFNQTYKLIDWAIKSNTVSVFTDCPHREKLGWLEQTHLMGASVHFNYAAAPLFRKAIRDMIQAQYPDGKIPEIAPEFTKFTPPFDESPEWGSAAIILPWYNYRWYGDLQTLDSAYHMMKQYTGYLHRKSNNGLLTHGLGDWFDIGPNKSGFAQMTKMGVTGTATFYYDLSIMAKAARLLKKDEDAAYYEQLASDVKKKFNDAYFDTQRRQYDSASQTANAMALYMGLTTPETHDDVVAALVRDIRGRNNALTAGDIGYRYVLRALEDAGRSDVIFDMNYRDDVPGYGYQLKHGATALTESWQAYPSVSNNHFMLGHLMEWFYAGLAGIGQTAGAVGYQHIEIRPEIVGDVKEVKATYQSLYGKIESAWSKQPGRFELRVTVPVNTKATVYLPATASAKVLQDGIGLNKVTIENGRAVLNIGSGAYSFSVQD
ncbi:glycoside hydrolase family 78 protein [Chitinophaga horti]|uniref:alpha-L-rhamnosidase n=1 Tax=Chitinophaga horti TaxID=2920382 RepID=A0ABY6J795_9BACT|nr:alpha-L-rhamnosidase [Chitinophaga horti]UYQ95554.1 glycoside hydrolase family 78 protein [Chitinophaga horti]